jgi:uncharacterized protein (DUF58 family)
MTLKRILKKVRTIDLKANNKINSLFIGNYRSVFFGRGIEFADLRPYEFGDDVRSIDWKTTAKHGKPFVKKYHESRNNTLFFVVDASLAMHFSSQDEKKFETLLEVFAILSFVAIKNGDMVGAIFYGNGDAKIFPPKKGKRHVLKMLSCALELYNENDKTPQPLELKKSFRLTQKILKHPSVVFWLSGVIPDLGKEQDLTKTLKTISLEHDLIPVVFSDKEERELSVRGEFVFQDSLTGRIRDVVIDEEVAREYSRIYQEKKKSFLHFFRRYRMESIFINNSDTIFPQLLMFFRKRQKHTV